RHRRARRRGARNQRSPARAEQGPFPGVQSHTGEMGPERNGPDSGGHPSAPRGTRRTLSSRLAQGHARSRCPMIHLSPRFLRLCPLAAAALLGACSWVPGMNRLTGEEGVFRDRQGEYLEAETIPRTRIPDRYDSYVIDDLYV